MIQEQVNERTVALSVRGAKITGTMLAKAMRLFLQHSKRPKTVKLAHGKQSLRSLSKHGAGLSNIEITNNNIGSFKRIARKYNVDFSLKRDDSVTPPKWLVFFKAKDADALTAAFNEYSRIPLKVKSAKPSLLTALKKFKELAKTNANPVKNRSRGEHEL